MYRTVWVSSTVALAFLGTAVFVVVIAVLKPGFSALALATAVFIYRRHSRSTRAGSTDARLWRRFKSAPLDVKSAVVLPVLATSWIGLYLLLGASGNRLVLLDLAGGLPLLMAMPASVALREFLADPGAAGLTGLQPAMAVPVSRPDVHSAGIAELDVVAAIAETGVSVSASSLSNAELCHAWRASHRAMLMSHNPAVRSRIADARGRYLDEFQRRDPDGFERWMSADAAGSADPEGFLLGLTNDGRDREAGPSD
jgi:hypothetical protein